VGTSRVRRAEDIRVLTHRPDRRVKNVVIRDILDEEDQMELPEDAPNPDDMVIINLFTRNELFILNNSSRNDVMRQRNDRLQQVVTLHFRVLAVSPHQKHLNNHLLLQRHHEDASNLQQIFINSQGIYSDKFLKE
jgi:hypothetical protein